MKRILYSALDKGGQSRDGYIEAQSNDEALETLTASGYTRIRFHDDASLSMPRSDLDGLSADQLQSMAWLEVRSRRNAGFGAFMLGVIKVNKLIILAGAGMLLWGLYAHSAVLLVIGITGILIMPLISTWNYRAVSNYNKLLIAYAEGRWNEVRKLAALLRKQMQNPEMELDLEQREVCALATEISLEAAISILEKRRDFLEKSSPGFYEARVALVCHLYGDYDAYVDHMRVAYSKSSRSPVLIIDLALAEARLGDPDKARSLIDSLNRETLPENGFPFLEWIQGLIHRGDAESDMHFRSAIAGLLALEGGPATWPSLAVCIGDYAIHAAQTESKDQAEKLLSTVWKVLSVHGEKPMLKQLSRIYPHSCI